MVELMTTMMTQQSQIQSENTKMLIEVLKDKKENTSDEEDGLGKGSALDKLKSLMEFAMTLKGGRAAEKSTLEVVGDIAGQIGIPILQTIQSYLQYASAMRSGGMAGPMAQGPPSMPPMIPEPPAPAAQPRGADMYRNGPPKVAVMPTPPTENNQPVQLAPQDQQVLNILMGFQQQIYQHMTDSVNGLPCPGAIFAEKLVGMFGPEPHAIIAKYQDESLVILAKKLPVWPQIESVYGEPHFRKWIADFKDYQNVLAEFTEEPEEGEPEK